MTTARAPSSIVSVATDVLGGATVMNSRPRPTTTAAGIPVASDEHSLTVGPGGPILLNDPCLIEQMAGAS
jgi:catalase